MKETYVRDEAMRTTKNLSSAKIFEKMYLTEKQFAVKIYVN